MDNETTIRVVLFEGAEIAAAFAIHPSGDGACSVVYERSDSTWNRGVGTALIVSLAHLFDSDSQAVPVGYREVADKLIEDVMAEQEAWPF